MKEKTEDCDTISGLTSEKNSAKAKYRDIVAIIYDNESVENTETEPVQPDMTTWVLSIVSTLWKERKDSHKLSSGFHKHEHEHTHTVHF